LIDEPNDLVKKFGFSVAVHYFSHVCKFEAKLYTLMEQRSLPLRLGFLGGGVMAEAIIRGIIEKKLVDPSSVTVYDVVESRLDLFQKMGVGTCKNSFEVLHADVIVLAVKPDVVSEALKSIKDGWKPEKHLLVSICAGVSIGTIEQQLVSKSRVIRVMPNTPCLVGEAAVAFSCGSCATTDDQKVVEKIFSSVGLASCVPEKLLDAVTGVSGSGPAYVYMFIEALADGGVLNGLPRDVSLSLATQTVLGAAKMVASGNEHPAKLRNAVESPGGITIHGTSTLEKHNFRTAVIQAVTAATNRAKELGGSK
jgi:pyrroline-5-carboxylate reductase